MATASRRRILETRSRTRDHYDKYPFRFDQRVIVDEKMNKRVMGRAIAALDSDDKRIFDIGCGACRVAQMVRDAGKGHAISVDLSRATLRAAREHNRDPVLNGDNMQLPIADEVADLVISNGVIMVTPDCRASFEELARIMRPGGTLVCSVYDRRSWYYPVYRFGGPLVRGLRSVIGDRGLKLTIFPFFHVATLALLFAVTRRIFWVPIDISFNLFHDQFTTPHCTFHTAEELHAWAEALGLDCVETRREAANQLITLRLEKPRPETAH